MTKRLDLTGQRVGRLTVVEACENYVSKTGRKYSAWLCRCDCGNYKKVLTINIRQKTVRSCGCLAKKVHSQSVQKAIKASTKHGDTGSRLYQIWAAMKRRCYNPNTAYYEIYGGRGVTVCESWQNYVPFKEWAYSVGYTDTLTLDRIDCDGDYTPNNCRWISIQEQQRNRRNNRRYEYNGNYYTVQEIAAMTGLKPRTVQGRIEQGWPIEKVIETPLKIMGRWHKQKE